MEKYKRQIDFILSVVCKHSGLNIIQLKKRTRKRNICQYRQLAFYFLLKYTRLTTSKVGEIFILNHATVIHGRKNALSLIEFDKEINELCAAIDLEIRQNIKAIDNNKETKEQVIREIIKTNNISEKSYWLARYNNAV